MFCMFILDRIDRELHCLKCVDLKFALSSEFSQFFDKISVRILRDVLFRVFRFFNAFFLCSDIFIHDILKLRRHLDTETYGSCHGNFVISHVKLQSNAEISCQN